MVIYIIFNSRYSHVSKKTFPPNCVILSFSKHFQITHGITHCRRKNFETYISILWDTCWIIHDQGPFHSVLVGTNYKYSSFLLPPQKKNYMHNSYTFLFLRTVFPVLFFTSTKIQLVGKLIHAVLVGRKSNFFLRMRRYKTYDFFLSFSILIVDAKLGSVSTP